MARLRAQSRFRFADFFGLVCVRAVVRMYAVTCVRPVRARTARTQRATQRIRTRTRIYL